MTEVPTRPATACTAAAPGPSWAGPRRRTPCSRRRSSGRGPRPCPRARHLPSTDRREEAEAETVLRTTATRKTLSARRPGPAAPPPRCPCPRTWTRGTWPRCWSFSRLSGAARRWCSLRRQGRGRAPRLLPPLRLRRRQWKTSLPVPLTTPLLLRLPREKRLLLLQLTTTMKVRKKKKWKRKLPPLLPKRPATTTPRTKTPKTAKSPPGTRRRTPPRPPAAPPPSPRSPPRTWESLSSAPRPWPRSS